MRIEEVLHPRLRIGMPKRIVAIRHEFLGKEVLSEVTYRGSNPHFRSQNAAVEIQLGFDQAPALISKMQTSNQHTDRKSVV